MLFYVDFKYVKDIFCVMLIVSSNTEAVCFSQIHRSIVKLVLLVASGEDESIWWMYLVAYSSESPIRWKSERIWSLSVNSSNSSVSWARPGSLSCEF